VKGAGYLLLTIGFLGGAFVSSLTEANEVDWAWFLPAVAVGAVGVALARIATHRESQHADKLTANIDVLHRSLGSVVENIRKLDAEKESMNPYDFHGRIDELFPGDLTAFVDARKSIGHVHGLAAYADVMNEFAAGERYLNRVWSASVDGYIDEVRDYTGRARHQFEEAQRKLGAL
jgi:hypothetical protein